MKHGIINVQPSKQFVKRTMKKFYETNTDINVIITHKADTDQPWATKPGNAPL